MDALLQFVQDIFSNMWALCQSMAFWLMFGFLLAGLLSQLIPQSLVRRHLAKPGFGSIFKAVLLGIPLPVCSCGVIPLAASMRKAGASRGAVAAFTATTPQTGVDSITVTYKLMGAPFMLARILSDFLAGLLAGTLINFTESKADKAQQAALSAPECPKCVAKQKAEEKARMGGFAKRFSAAFKEAFLGLPATIGKYIVLGVFLGALITTLIPDGALEQYIPNEFLAFALMSVVGIPMYVCSVGAIPIAFALVAAGFSPGAALVFLALGPATSMATITVLWKMLGKRATVIYIASLTAASWTVGALINAFGVTLSAEHIEHTMSHGSALDSVLAAAMLAMFIVSYILKKRKDGVAKSCCASQS